MTQANSDQVRPASILELHNMGFKVVPIGIDGKTPVIKWSDVYEKGWTAEELSLNYDKFVGIATCFGQSHLKDEKGLPLYLNCLDIDSPDVFRILVNLEDTITKKPYSLIDECSKRTVVVKTKKIHGYHIYWLSHMQNKGVKAEDTGRTFEIKTDKAGGLATLPPSPHRDDNSFRYNHIGQRRIEISDGLYDAVTNLLKDFMKSQTQKEKKPYSMDAHEESIEFSDDENGLICSLLQAAYKKGYRHSFCLYLSGFLHKNAVSLHSARKLLTLLTKSDEEQSARLHSLEETYKKERSQVSGYSALYNLVASITDEKIAKRVLGALYSLILTKKGVEDNNDLAYQLAETLKKENVFKTMNDTREVYYYQGGKFVNKPTGERLIEIECAKLVPTVRSATVDEIVEFIRRTTPINRADFDNDLFTVNVLNGLINLRTGEIRDHSPDYPSVVQLPIRYNKKATCKRVIHFLYSILSPKDVPLVLEFIAYCLIRNTDLQKAFLVTGEEDNGKSVLLSLIRAFLGVDNTSSKTLHQLTSNRFASADLFGKLANIFADISAKRLEDVETFKVLVTGDRLSVEKKGKDFFDVDLYAKLVFSANTPPKPNDDMDGSYYRRWLLVQVMLRSHDYFTKKPIAKDRNLVQKLTTPDELSGLLNLVLISAQRLLLKLQFCRNSSTEDIREEYQRLSDPVKAWIDARCALGPNHEGNKNEIHGDFVQFAWERRLNRMEVNALGRELTKFGVHDAQRGSGKNRVHVWTGIALRKNLKDEDQTTID